MSMSTNPIQRGRIHQLDDKQRRALRKALRFVGLFRSIEKRMPSSYMETYLRVAMEPGLGPSDYAKDMAIVQALASRILLELGSFARERDTGLGLVDRQLSATSAAKQEYFLTPKGQRLMNQIVDILEE